MPRDSTESNHEIFDTQGIALGKFLPFCFYSLSTYEYDIWIVSSTWMSIKHVDEHQVNDNKIK